MKLKTKKFGKLFMFGIIFFVMPATFAQFGGPPGFDDHVNDEAPTAPINGLIGLTLLAGAFYGGKKLQKTKNE